MSGKVSILGISAFYHDSAACLVRDGEIVAAAQEERFTRLKHDSSFPVYSVAYCLDEGGIDPASLDLVVFHEKPFIRFDRIMETYLAYAPAGVRQFTQAMPAWLREKLWIRERIHRETGFEGTILFPSHHETHAAAAFFPSPFNEAAILTMDGVGEWATAAYGRGSGSLFQLEGQLRFPHSLGLLYSAFTYFSGFRVNSDEYKVMGLAPYGVPKYRDLILDEVMDLKDDGSFRLNMEYFNYCAGLTMTSERFNRLFGDLPRKPGEKIRQLDMDLAASVQQVTEEVVLKLARFVRDETGLSRLVMSGGVALNSVANGKLVDEDIFEDLWIQPAAGDAGSAVGAALFGWHQYLGNGRPADGRGDRMKGALLGPSYSDPEIKKQLDSMGAAYREVPEPELLREAARGLSEGKVTGWFQGRMEFGPRALGSRSILADARNPEMQSRINEKIKFRESFRPFAPSVLQESAAEYFELGTESAYMLKVVRLNSGKLITLNAEQQNASGFDKLKVARSRIPAVTHVDNTARPQTVEDEGNTIFGRLLREYEHLTGSPMLVNTSFNARSEPIVCSPEDAYRCFMATGMDRLVLGSFLLEKDEQDKGSSARDMDPKPDVADPAIRKQLRTFGLSAGAGMLILAAVLRWKFDLGGVMYFPAVLGGSLLLLAITAPGLLLPVKDPWERAAGKVGWALFKTMLGVGYFAVVTPVALVARLSGRDHITRGVETEKDSYWESCPDGDPGSSFKQY
jgi:carbamoyltransferase